MRLLTHAVIFGAGVIVGAGSLYIALPAKHVIAVSQAAGAPTPSPPAATLTNEHLAEDEDDVHRILRSSLAMPIASMSADDLRDTFSNPRPGRKTHEAIDIPARRGTPIHALGDGVIARLSTSKKGGISIYEVDPSSIYCYYYAHLARYANRLHRGMVVRHGDVIGYVGTSGDAKGPHLHLSITRVDGELWEGAPIDPYPVLVAISR